MNSLYMKLSKLLYIWLLFPALVMAQHTIKATFSPAEHFNWAILYKMSPTKNRYVAQAKISEDRLEFLLDSTATKGIYKLVYAAPKDEYNFDVIYNAEEDIELTFNSNEGVVFQKSTENILLDIYLNAMAAVGEEIENFYISNNKDTLVIKALFQKQKKLQKEYEDKSKNTLTNHFIKANSPYIPNKFETPKNYIDNLTANYFENIDFKDAVLQSSNFLINRSMSYIIGVASTENDVDSSYNFNIDIIYTLLKSTDSNYQKVFLKAIWQKLVNYKLSKSANYLAATYLIPLAVALEDRLLVVKLTQFKNLSIGNVAPDFSLENEGESDENAPMLTELALAENYILVFWSSTCSHCLKEIPKLNALVQNLENTKYKVVAVALEDDKLKWEREILKYLDFINVLKLNKWDNEIIKTYSLASTPTYFVLDKDKQFIAKPESFEDLKTYLEE